jgi:ferredoxin-NADP reductase
MTHPLADRYAGSDAVLADIRAREPDTADHAAATAATIAAHHPKRLILRIGGIVVETPSTSTFRLVGEGDLPPFLAGQYVNLFLDGTSRPFAISSSPAALDHYDLTVRRVPGGRISNLMLDTLRVGDTVVTTGPMGTFHHNPLFHGDDLIFLAGGSGVAPAMSMIRDILDTDANRRLHLIYGSRRADDVIFAQSLAAIDDERIRVDHVIAEPPAGWTGAAGLLSAELIARVAGDLAGRMVYVCGPQAFYDYALAQLRASGHPTRRIRFESNGAPADATAQASWPAGVDPAGEVSVTVRGTTFRTRRGRPLLDALEDHGIQPEVACRSGECSLCRVRVRSGVVHSADEARLRRSDAAAGYVHSCVAYPITDVALDV